ncbi:DNA primase small subunit-like [Styela clava]
MSEEKEIEVKKETTNQEEFAYDASSLPSLLPIYYKLLFPYGPFYSWLSYGGLNKTTFSNREFSFTLQNDIYVRYQSFTSQQEMEKEIQKMKPHKIDIGAIFSHPPKDHNKYHSGIFKPLEKELVFDIDMTDYDDVRKCCQGADICTKCWPLMTMAIKLIDRALREDFGFMHRLWIYSGRRGVHCWVCDDKVRKLPNKARSAIVDYLSVIQGGNLEKRVNLKDPVHPFLRHCITTISKQHWEEYRQAQEILETPSDVEKVLKMVPDAEMKEKLKTEFNNDNRTTETRWERIRKATAERYQEDMKKYRKLRYTPQEIMLEFCYPRLDANVSTSINHLLKSPFSVHPKTGRVCVPIDIDSVDDFDPFAVPTISQLCHELDSQKAEKTEDNSDGSTRKIHLYKTTSIKKHVKIFEDFVNKLLADSRKEKLNQKDATMDF